MQHDCSDAYAQTLDSPRGAGTGRRKPADVSPEAKAGLAWLHSTRFLTTASRLDQLRKATCRDRVRRPQQRGQVVRDQHARAAAPARVRVEDAGPHAAHQPVRARPARSARRLSRRPPGYGYAAVDRGKKLVWQKVMADYLDVRRALAGVVLMVDSRHGFTPLDRQLLDFVAQRVRTGEVKLLVLLTKVDKLGKREAQAAVDAAQEVLGEFVTESSTSA
jgi:GTP-binding protein